ncbi:MAG TPA: hypothetical protein DDZ80_24150 [Cyanobacteria bacterium UBA8803]|nr:hypothetical protein [Cyanobacteria bacterium UBA8803]
MNDCPCCSNRLLRHIRHNTIYWYCSRCRQAMPVLDEGDVALHEEFQLRTTLNAFFAQPISALVKA